VLDARRTRQRRQENALTRAQFRAAKLLAGADGGARAARRRTIAVIDRREIEFDAAALVLAISASLRAAQGFGLPALPPTGVRYYPHEGQIDVIYGTDQTTRAVRLAAEALGALLVAFCIRTKIPMPRHADKGIRIEADCVILAFRTHYADAPIAETADRATRIPAGIKAWTWVEPEAVPTGR
jgi:hypothetical protein